MLVMSWTPAKARCFRPVGIFEMPVTIHHFGWTTEETIIQEHGIGPMSVNYLKPGTTRPFSKEPRAAG